MRSSRTSISGTLLQGNKTLAMAMGLALSLIGGKIHASNGVGYNGPDGAPQAIPLAADRGYTGEKIMDAFVKCMAKPGLKSQGALSVIQQLSDQIRLNVSTNDLNILTSQAKSELPPRSDLERKSLRIHLSCANHGGSLNWFESSLDRPTAQCSPSWTINGTTQQALLFFQIYRPSPQPAAQLVTTLPSFRFVFANQESVLNAFGEEDSSKIVYYGLSLIPPQRLPVGPAGEASTATIDNVPAGTLINTNSKRATRFRYNVEEAVSCLSEELSKRD